jgi:hypothetical protein
MSTRGLSTTLSADAESLLSVKERLIALLSVYAPPLLMSVNALLEEFKGRERALFRCGVARASAARARAVCAAARRSRDASPIHYFVCVLQHARAPVSHLDGPGVVDWYGPILAHTVGVPRSLRRCREPSPPCRCPRL